MDRLSLLDEAGADAVALLSIAELTGMSVLTRADKLVIRGPQNAGAVAERLLANKLAVIEALGVYVYGTHAKTVEKLNSVDVDGVGTGDDWGFRVGFGEQLIDPATLTPCPRCSSLDTWWPAVGAPRCQDCDPPVANRRLLKRAENIWQRQTMLDKYASKWNNAVNAKTNNETERPTAARDRQFRPDTIRNRQAV